MDIIVTLFGVPVKIEIWSIVIFIVFFFDGYRYIKKQWPRLKKNHYILPGIFVTITLVLSIALHEFAHGLVSYVMGTPIDHAGMTWWGAYVSPVSNFLEVSPIQEILVSLAGPGMNFLIGILAAIPVYFYGESLWENTIQYVSYANLMLARFNMFPIIFLDGSKVLAGFLRFFITDPQTLLIAQGIVGFIFIMVYFGKRRKHIEDRLETL